MGRKTRKGSVTATRGRRPKRQRNKTWLFVTFGVAILLLVVWLGYAFWPSSDWINGNDMEEYVKTDIPLETALPDEFDSYIDFSDGMQFAYVNPEIKNNLKGVVNKLTKNSEFYSLANGEIIPMGKMESTKIYNQIIDAKSYNNQAAPIEKSLEIIVKNGRPAFMVTDFEEYNNGIIQQENYAKKYFTDWLAMGNDINFYVMDFKEKNKEKHLYFVVFDGKEHKLLKEVEDALAGRSGNLKRYTLSNNNFPMARDYGEQLKNHTGGNYHNEKGVDAVTVVDEKGGSDSFKIYDGYLAEYYPSNGETWEKILKNAEALSPEALNNAKDVVPFNYVVAGRFVDLSRNTGYNVKKLGLRVQDVSGPYLKTTNGEYNGNTKPVSVSDFLILDNAEVQNPQSHEIRIKFDPKFNGRFPANIDPNALFKADVVIEEVEPIVSDSVLYPIFGWDGNTSLEEAVRNTLQTSAPEGKRLFTIYFHLKK